MGSSGGNKQQVRPVMPDPEAEARANPVAQWNPQYTSFINQGGMVNDGTNVNGIVEASLVQQKREQLAAQLAAQRAEVAAKAEKAKSSGPPTLLSQAMSREGPLPG